MAHSEVSFVERVMQAFKKTYSEITPDTLEHDFSPRFVEHFVKEVLGYSGNEYIFERGRTDITLLDENGRRVVVIETKRPKEDLDAEKWRGQAGKYADSSTLFVGLANGYRMLLWEVREGSRQLKVDLNIRVIIESKRASEGKLTTQETGQILFLRNISREQVCSGEKYSHFDQYYAKIDVCEGDGFGKLLGQLNYLSNELLKQYTYSAFDEYYAGYAQYRQTKDELEQLKRMNGKNARQAADIARFELKTEGKFKKYADFSGYFIWKAISNRPDEKEEENKQVFCKESIYLLLNRLLFIRICEDKGLLGKKISNGGIERLREQLAEPVLGDTGVFKQIVQFSYGGAKSIYNHFYEKDNPLDWYESGDGELDRVLNRVLWSLNQFNFSKVDRDILGKLYEKYLPKEERKRLGEFYTPEEVIDYILDAVEYVPQKAIEGKDLIDPACGSGGFLVRAARRLIARQAVKFGKATPKEALDNSKWHDVYSRLTPKECEEIVSSVAMHLHGFDINPFAVSITEMNLLFQVIDLYSKAVKENRGFKVPRFKVYETDSLEMPADQTNLPQFYGSTGKSLAKDKEATDELKKKKYDFVVGNPPYVRIQQLDRRSREAYSKSYVTAKGNYDLYVPFIELGIRLLDKNSKLGYICSNQFFKRDYGRALRQFIISNSHIRQIINFKDSGVFEDATNYPTIIILATESLQATEIISVNAPESGTLNEIIGGVSNRNIDRFTLDLERLGNSEWMLENPRIAKLEEYFFNCKPLGEVADIISGAQTGSDGLFLGRRTNDGEIFTTVNLRAESVKSEHHQVVPFLLGRQVRRYLVEYGDRVALFPYFRKEGRYYLPTEIELRTASPKLYEYLSRKKQVLEKRLWYGQTAEQLHGAWFAYMYFKADLARNKLIVTPALTNKARFAPAEKEVLFALGTAGVFGVSPKLDYYFTLGVLNSKLVNFTVKRLAPEKRGGYFQLNSKVLSRIPMKVPTNKEEATIANKISDAVKEILKLKKRDAGADTKKTESRIDSLVFKLYGISVEDEKIILNEVD
ncbi:N-6 DNA methylase [Candidatus Micrarchaeota archaeon]|nr:N-6 DNA methylase [Candidatus Micrarchaeota archaeon]